MKLRNKKTGEIVATNDLNVVGEYDSLTKLTEEWEDYKEPKEAGYWYYDTTINKPDLIESCNVTKEDKKLDRQIGNYFETKEEVEKAVEKLEAWKRLKDKGFKFLEWYRPDGCEPFIVIETNIDNDDVEDMKLQLDLDLLFGGEE